MGDDGEGVVSACAQDCEEPRAAVRGSVRGTPAVRLGAFGAHVDIAPQTGAPSGARTARHE